MADFQASAEASVLSAGIFPQWTTQPVSETPPTAAGSGVSLAPGNLLEGKAVWAQVQVNLRREAHRRRVDITFAHDAATTYTVDIDASASPASVATPADLEALLTDMQAAIASSFSGTVSCVIADDDDADQTATPANGTKLILYGVDESQYSVQAATSGGSGEADLLVDGKSATVRPWTQRAQQGVSPSYRWSHHYDGATKSEIDMNYQGYGGLLQVAGRRRLHIQLDALAAEGADSASSGGTLSIWSETLVGPCSDAD